MKKNIIFYACVAAALMFVSCQKETPATEGPQTPSEGLDVITATIMATKTTPDGVNVLWENGDKIGLRPYSEVEANASGMVEYVTTLGSNAASATFVMVEDETDQVAMRNGKYIALYPSDPVYSLWRGKDETVRVGIPNVQEAPVGGGWYDKSAIMIATAGSEGNFTFHHVMSYIKLTVDEQSPEFDKMVITSNSDQNMTDRIDVHYDGKYSLASLASYQSTSVTLTTTEAGTFSSGTYYAAILPQTYTGGFTFMFYNDNELIGSKSVEADVEFARGDVANIGVIGAFTEMLPDPLKMATVYEENGKKQGVVFWVDPANPYKGKIVSVCSEQILWAVSGITEPNSTDTNDGLANFATVTGLDKYKEDPDNYPAMKYCADMRSTLGGNWYLPVASEMQNLYNAYYGLSNSSWKSNTDYRVVDDVLIDMTPKRNFDSALRLLGETATATLDGDASADGVSDNAGYGTGNGVTYHLSKVNSGGKPQYLRIGNYSNSSGTMTTARYVRCIRDVEVK